MEAAFLGLGTMGTGMAQNLVRSGQPCLICSEKEEKLLPFQKLGARTSTRRADAAECGCIFLCLPDGAVVREVLLGPDGLLPHLKPGQVVVDCSTIGYLEARELAGVLAEKGVDLVDAPVSGHRERAMDGTLTIMCGGRRAAFDRVKPLLDCMGTTVLYMGPAGSGQLTKMINNCCLNICAASFCELMPLGVKLGLDPEQLGQVLMTASGSSYASKTLIPEILRGNFDHGFTMDRAYKDMEGMAGVCARYQVPLPTLSGAMQTYQLALRHGEGERYKGAMIRVYEDMLGVECREAQRTEGETGAPERE